MSEQPFFSNEQVLNYLELRRRIKDIVDSPHYSDKTKIQTIKELID